MHELGNGNAFAPRGSAEIRCPLTLPRVQAGHRVLGSLALHMEFPLPEGFQLGHAALYLGKQAARHKARPGFGPFSRQFTGQGFRGGFEGVDPQAELGTGEGGL